MKRTDHLDVFTARVEENICRRNLLNNWYSYITSGFFYLQRVLMELLNFSVFYFLEDNDELSYGKHIAR